MTLSGTSSRFAVWDDMAMEERLSWVACDPAHPLATTIGSLRIEGWSIPPLPIPDRNGEIHDGGFPVVASTAVGADAGRVLVDRETFDAKLAEFDDARRKREEEAMSAAAEQNKQAAAAIASVDDENVRAALEAIYSPSGSEKGKS